MDTDKLLKEAEYWEDDGTDRIKTLQYVTEETKQTLKHMTNLEENGRQIGIVLKETYSEKELDNFINGLKKGYKESTEINEYDLEEEKTIQEAVSGLKGKIIN